MTISQWSKTPASNATAGLINFAEGQAPSTVNDSARQLMADVRTFYEGMEWRDFGHVPTFVSATTFTIPTDVTATYHAGRRIQCAHGATLLYGSVSSSSYAAPNSTVTVALDSAGVLSNTLSAVALGIAATNSGLPPVTNLAGGAAGAIPYQSAAGTTAMLGAGTAGQVLTSAGATPPVWQAVSGVPVGTVIDFAGAAAPTGYLVCPTAATNISRATYAALFAAIGTTWGVGDGTTTFGMPWFPADYTAIQASGNVGTSSVGAVGSHSHTIPAVMNSQVWMTGAVTGTSGLQAGASGANTSATGGAANLSAGVRVLKCVKYQ